MPLSVSVEYGWAGFDEAGGVQMPAARGRGDVQLVVVLQVPGDGVRAGVEAFAGQGAAQFDDEIPPTTRIREDHWPRVGDTASMHHDLMLITRLFAATLLTATVVAGCGPDRDQTAGRTTITTTPTTTTSAAPPVSTDPNKDLWPMLPAAYGPDSCKPATPEAPALAEILCDAHPLPDGPTRAWFRLYADSAALADAFWYDVKHQSRTWQVVPCQPGRNSEPFTWHDDDTPNETAGWIVCGDFNGESTVTWTRDADLFIGGVHGLIDVASLYDWWTKNR